MVEIFPAPSAAGKQQFNSAWPRPRPPFNPPSLPSLLRPTHSPGLAISQPKMCGLLGPVNLQFAAVRPEVQIRVQQMLMRMFHVDADTLVFAPEKLTHDMGWMDGYMATEMGRSISGRACSGGGINWAVIGDI